MMNLSQDTISILKNFSDINTNILVNSGQQLKTISTMKNIQAVADISESFEQEFGIYDLPEFLRAVELFDKSNIAFNGGANLTINDTSTKQSIKYFFADKSVIVSPSKTINMPDKYVTFNLKKESFDRLMKGCTTLNLPDVALKGDGKVLSMVATDKKTPSSNDYSIEVGETDKTFTAYFKTENFKMIRDDYDVAISQQKLSHFINKNKPIQYWIALEADSEF